MSDGVWVVVVLASLSAFIICTLAFLSFREQQGIHDATAYMKTHKLLHRNYDAWEFYDPPPSLEPYEDD